MKIMVDFSANCQYVGSNHQNGQNKRNHCRRPKMGFNMEGLGYKLFVEQKVHVLVGFVFTEDRSDEQSPEAVGAIGNLQAGDQKGIIHHGHSGPLEQVEALEDGHLGEEVVQGGEDVERCVGCPNGKNHS